MSDDAVRGVHHAALNWTMGATLTLTQHNTQSDAQWACAAVWTRSPSRLVLATISHSSCSPPPILVCSTGIVGGTPGIVLTLWFLQPRPEEFSIEICVAQPGASGYDTVHPWRPDQ